MSDSGRGSERMDITISQQKREMREDLGLHPDLIADTEEFYAKFFVGLPKFDRDRLRFRIRFLREEMLETDRAADDVPDIENIIDGCIDLMVVALGTLHEMGVDISKAWREVHKANMNKIRNVNESRFGSAGWDLVKPAGWKAPNHSGNHKVGDLS